MPCGPRGELQVTARQVPDVQVPAVLDPDAQVARDIQVWNQCCFHYTSLKDFSLVQDFQIERDLFPERLQLLKFLVGPRCFVRVRFV